MIALKPYIKYVLWIIVAYLLTSFLIFVGFNASYKEISLKHELPEQITIKKAEANKNQGRVYGYVQNEEQNNLNGKYIKISVYNSSNENIAKEFLKIENLKSNEQKLFKANFNAKDAKNYEVSITNEIE